MKNDNCIFCKIAAGEIPSKTVYEDDMFRVVMDLGAASEGHALILPKNHYTNLMELDEKGIRYEDVDEYWFFLHSILPSLQSDIVHIILPNLHIESMILGVSKDSDEEIVIDPDHSVTINKDTYVQLTRFLRTMFGFKYEPKIAQNELTRSKMIELAKRKKKKKKQNNDSSVLLPLISSMVNCADFKYSYSDVWDMPFFAFMDSVKRVNANRTSNQMCTGGYFGLKLSDVKDYTDWMRSL